MIVNLNVQLDSEDPRAEAILRVLGYAAKDVQDIKIDVEDEAPAKTTTSAKKAATKKAAAKPKPEPEEDLVGGSQPTLQDAVALATTLVGKGKSAEVKAALKEQGVNKVSELTDPEDIAAFIEALS